MNAPDALHFALAAYRRRTNKITLDDIVGSVRFGVRRRSKKNGGSVGNPYRMPIDLRVPAPRDGRPISADGCTAFHFRMSVVRKGGGGTSGQMEQGTDTSKGGDGGSASNPAVAHERYIVDEWERALERTAGIEDYLDDGIEEEQGRAVFVTSNIGQTLADREAFWKDLWGRERTAAPPTIEFDLDRCGEAEWRRFITDPHAPQAVQDLAAKGLAGNLEMPKRPGRQPRRRCVSVEIDDAVDVTWLASINREFGARKADRAVHYREGRSGQVQVRLEAELPHEVGVDRNIEIARALAADLMRLGIPHTIVVHVPVKRNDRRNVHLHVVLHPRCCSFREDGQLDLTAGRKLRPGDLAALLPAVPDAPAGEPDRRSRYKQLAGKDMRALRWRMAHLMNHALEHSGLAARYDARTYEEMGIVSTPMRRLGSTETLLMRAGVSVENDRHNADVSRNAVLRRAAEKARDRRHAYEDQLFKLRAAMGWGPHPRRAVRRLQLLDRMMSDVAEGRDRLHQHDIARELAESASRRLIGHTATLLNDIANGTASASEVRLKDAILARHGYARRHLEEIENAVEPYQREIDRFRDKINRREDRIGALVRIVEADIDRHHWQVGSVLAEHYPERLIAAQHFNALIDAIHGQEQSPLASGPVHVRQIKKGDYEITGLGAVDRKLIFGPAFSSRRAAALAGIAKRQIGEVEKLLADVRENGVPITQRPGRLGVLWALHEKHPIFLVGRDAAQQSYERNFFGVKGREPTTFASTIPQSISRAQSTAGAKPVISVPSSQVSEAVVTSSAVPDHHVVLPSIQTKTEPVQPPRPVAKPSSDNKAKPAPSDSVGEAPAVMAREAPEKSGPALYETAAYVGVAVTSSYVPGHLTESSSTTNRSTVSATVDAGPSRPTSTTTVEQKDRAEKGGDAGGLGAITPTRLPAPQSEESGPTVEQPRRLSPVRAETEAAQVDPIIVRPQEEATPAQAGSATTTNLPPPSDNGPGARSPSAAGVQSTAVPTNDVPVIQGNPVAESDRSADTTLQEGTRKPKFRRRRASASTIQKAMRDYHVAQASSLSTEDEKSSELEGAAGRRETLRDRVREIRGKSKAAEGEDGLNKQEAAMSAVTSAAIMQRQQRGDEGGQPRSAKPASASDLFHRTWSKRDSYKRLAPQDQQWFELFAQAVDRENAGVYRKDGDLFLWYKTELAGRWATELLEQQSGHDFLATLAELPARAVDQVGSRVRLSPLIGADGRPTGIGTGEGLDSR